MLCYSCLKYPLQVNLVGDFVARMHALHPKRLRWSKHHTRYHSEERSLEYSYYGREESNADLRISMAADDCDEIEPLEQLRRVRSPEDVVRLGRAHGEDVAYESIGQADLQKLKREFFALFPNRFGSLIKRAN